MTDPKSGNWIVYNGEVYNFREVRAKLERAEVRFHSQSDTEVVLKAYGRWGEKCLQEFRGMFAFAIWDAHRRRLFLARDRLGVKPLYYYFEDGQFLFSSEVRALLQSGLVRRRLNPVGLINYLSFGSVYDPETLIEGVYALRPGHYLVWEEGRIREVEYWEIGQSEGQGDLAAMKPSASDKRESKKMLNQLQAVLEEAVRLRLVSDVPVGVFLSGGIDSSALVGILSRNASSSVSTFSIIFKELGYSEARFSRLIARRFSTDHHEMLLSQRDAMEAIPDAIGAMDQPTMDGINTYIVSREARRAGLKVALSGLGGDEVFAGYESFKTVPLMERCALVRDHFPLSLRRLAAAACGKLLPVTDRNQKFVSFLQQNGTLIHPYALSRMLFLPDQLKQLLRLPKEISLTDAFQPITSSLRRARKFDPVNRVSYLEIRNYLQNTLLRDTDFMSMAHGLEVRVPLIDYKLIEYLFSLPGALKMNGHTPKPLLIEATRGLLPSEVIYRPKRGFTLPFERWLRDELRNEVEKVLLRGDESHLDDFIRPEGIESVWEAFLSGHTSWSRPWALYVLRRWCGLHL